MDSKVYERLNQIELEHWWFVGRRRILMAALVRFCNLQSSIRILEAGVGTGGNIAMLQRLGTLYGFECNAQARKLATEKTGFTVAYGALPNDIPFADEAFDLICLFDVLEHIEQDSESLSSLSKRLAPGGRIVLTVPAYPWLWSQHDITHHHFRRYTRKSLQETVSRANLKVEQFFNFNVFLMPLIMVVRGLKRLSGSQEADDGLPSSILNGTLCKIFAAERHLIGRIPMPIGVSLGAVIKLGED